MIAPLSGKSAQSVALARHRLNIWDGSVRSSKTVSSEIAWLNFIRNGPEGNLLMTGKTERTLKRNVIDPLQEMIGASRCRYALGSGEMQLLGRRVYVAGANDERSLTKIQGMTLAGTYGDEISTWPESYFSMLLTRLSLEGAQLFGTTNPEGPKHWLLEKYLRRAVTRLTREGAHEDYSGDKLDLARFSFVLDDNPHLPAAYVAALKNEFSGLWFKRYILGQWVLAEGVIYDMLDHEKHVVDELPSMRRYWVAIDYGTANDFVALLVGEGEDEKLYVCREFRWASRKEQQQLTDRQYSEKLRQWLDRCNVEFPGAGTPERIIVDPSATSFIVQLYDDGWEGVTKAINDVLDGIRSVSSLLSINRLKIHKSCSGLLTEMQSYVWDEKAAERGEDKPIKEVDHGPDGLRYCVMGTRQLWRYWLNDELEQAA